MRQASVPDPKPKDEAMKHPAHQKNPYSPTTIVGTPCWCANCGTVAYADVAAPLPAQGGKKPANWLSVIVKINEADVLLCPQCLNKRPYATGFRDAYSAGWNGANARWEFAPRTTAEKKRDSEEINTTIQPIDEGKNMSENGSGTKGVYLSDSIRAPEESDPGQPSLTAKAMEQFAELGGAMALGGKLALVDQGGEVMLNIARNIAKKTGNPAITAALETPEGREAVKVLIALGIHSVGTYAPTLLPASKGLKRLAADQVTVSSFKLGVVIAKELAPMLQELATLGDQLEALDPTPPKQMAAGAPTASGSVGTPASAVMASRG